MRRSRRTDTQEVGIKALGGRDALAPAARKRTGVRALPAPYVPGLSPLFTAAEGQALDGMRGSAFGGVVCGMRGGGLGPRLEPGVEILPEGAEPPLRNRCAHGPHQGLIEGDIVPGQHDLTEDFL